MKIEKIVIKRNLMINGQPFEFGDEIAWDDAGLTVGEAKYLANIGKVELVEEEEEKPKAGAKKPAKRQTAESKQAKSSEKR